MIGNSTIPPALAGVYRLALVALAASLPAGCAHLPPEARQRLRQAQADYQTGRYDHALAACDEVIRAHPANPATAEAYYLRAQCYLRTDRPDAARPDLERAIQLSRREDLTARAQLALAGIHMDAGDLETACALCQRALPALGTTPGTDEWLYRCAQAMIRSGRWKPGRALLARLFTTFRGGPFEEQARRLFAWPRDAFAIQCGSFTDPRNADRLLARLRDHRLEAYREIDEVNGQPRHTVRVGRYPRYDDARRDLPAVRRLVPDAFIVP